MPVVNEGNFTEGYAVALPQQKRACYNDVRFKLFFSPFCIKRIGLSHNTHLIIMYGNASFLVKSQTTFIIKLTCVENVFINFDKINSTAFFEASTSSPLLEDVARINGVPGEK